ncbi:MAG: class I adenylate-forming enzyme family protein [Dongiaceae bacterium]
MIRRHDALCRAIERAPMPNDLGLLLDQAAERWPDRTALLFVDTEDSLSFARFREETLRAAAALAALGVVKGSHVAVMSHNCPQVPVLWFALARIGAVQIPVNSRYTPRELAYVMETGDAEFLLIHKELLPTYEAMDSGRLPDARLRVIAGEGRPDAWEAMLAAADPGRAPRPKLYPEDPTTIQFTSGTTGFPKGCVLTHRYWVTMAQAKKAMIEFDLKRALYNQNFFYLDGPILLLLAIHKGATLVMVWKPSATRFLEWARRYAIQYLYFFEPLYKQPERPEDGDTALELVHIYGFNKNNHADLERRFKMKAREAFGMTESGAAFVMPFEADHWVGSGSIGLPIAFREAMVADDAGDPVPVGEQGELCVRGPGMMLGYYNNPEATAASFHQGWLRTGDLARRDGNGFYYIVGRKKEMIRRNSENIAVREVEEVIRGIAAIEEVAVVPVPDPVVGEEVKAYVKLKPGADPAETNPEAILAFCRERLAPFKMPRFIAFRESFPMTDSSRVEKKKLLAEDPDLRRGSYDRVEGRWL